MYQALYRSFRPETFDTLLGQEHIVRILKNQIASGKTGHAYLFTGTRGTGKTTTARLLAKALNCTSAGERPCGCCDACKAIANGSFLDVIEIDAASNNGVDDIRDLRESVNFPPALGRNKVYIIDEAHMLTGSASNALLKTIEEPPENVVFILATTDPNKLPATILSRCLRLDFRRVSEEVLTERFRYICNTIGAKADDDALALIASNADGSVRDGLSLLDRCVSSGPHLTRDDVLFLLGMAGTEVFVRLTDHILKGKTGEALALFAGILAEGKETVQFIKDWLEHLRDLLIIKYTKDPQNVLNLSLENIKRLAEQSKEISTEQLRRYITEISAVLSDARYSPRPRILAELAIVKLAEPAASSERAEDAVRKPGPKPQAERKNEEIHKAESVSRSESVPGPAAFVSNNQGAKTEKIEATDILPEKSPEKKPEKKPENKPEKKKPISYSEVEDISDEELAEINKMFSAGGPDEGMSELWDSILHDSRVPMQIQMSGAALLDMTDEELVILVASAIKADRFKTHSNVFETIIEERTGRKLKFVVKTDEE